MIIRYGILSGQNFVVYRLWVASSFISRQDWINLRKKRFWAHLSVCSFITGGVIIVSHDERLIRDVGCQVGSEIMQHFCKSTLGGDLIMCNLLRAQMQKSGLF
jgi:hypothetical protein